MWNRQHRAPQVYYRTLSGAEVGEMVHTPNSLPNGRSITWELVSEIDAIWIAKAEGFVENWSDLVRVVLQGVPAQPDSPNAILWSLGRSPKRRRITQKTCPEEQRFRDWQAYVVSRLDPTRAQCE